MEKEIFPTSILNYSRSAVEAEEADRALLGADQGYRCGAEDSRSAAEAEATLAERNGGDGQGTAGTCQFEGTARVTS